MGLPESPKDSHCVKTIKQSCDQQHIIYQGSNVKLLDGVKLFQRCWFDRGSSHPSQETTAFKIPNYWFNLHHPYVKSNSSKKRFKADAPDGDRVQKTSEKSGVSTDSVDLMHDFIKEEFNDFYGSKGCSLFPYSSTQYLDTEPHRPNAFLWKDAIKFPEYLDMMKSMLFFSTQRLNKEHEMNKVLISGQKELKLTLDQLYFKLIANESNSVSTFKVLPFDVEYWMPPRSSFIISDLSQASELLLLVPLKCGFDLIVIDPPYTNISAKRSQAYNMEDIYRLFELPVPKLLNSEGGMVAVWITNRRKVRRFIINKLFKDWGISLVAEWAWVKVTTGGEPVLSFDSKHKKPYELILIGVKGIRNHKTGMPQRHVLVSVPCKIHSRKPPLFDFLAPYLPQRDEPLFLELFGRSLYPNTLTWGNEPIKFQTVAPYR